MELRMKLCFISRQISLTAAVITAMCLTACKAPAKIEAPAAAVKPVNTQLTQRILGDGLYELAYSPAEKALFIASAQGFKNVNGGMIYRLDPVTLATQGETHTDL